MTTPTTTTRPTPVRSLVLALLLALATVLAAAAPASAQDGKRDEPTKDDTSAEEYEKESPDLDDRLPTKVDPTVERAVAALQERIARHVAEHGTKNTFASWVDATTGEPVLETDASEEVVKELTQVKDDEQREILERIDVRRREIRDTWHRRDDIQSFWGGAGIRVNGGLCSSGYAVRSASGYRYSVTAGHCFADWSTVRTESNNNVYGTTIARRLPTVTGDPIDMELTYGKSYAGRIYTGGVTSTSSARVVSAGQAWVGYTNYCHSGRTTGERCGHTATSTNGQVCTQSGCKSPVIVFTGGTIIQGGDSGGPFYAKSGDRAWIRGHNIASSTSTGFVQPWTTVAAEYGVSIVTG